MAVRTLADIVKNKELKEQFEYFLVKNGGTDVYKFVTQKQDPETAYKNHLGERPRNDIGVSSKIKSQAQKVYKLTATKFITPMSTEADVEKGIFSQPYWSDVVSAAQKDRKAFLEKTFIPRFLKAQEQSTKEVDEILASGDGKSSEALADKIVGKTNIKRLSSEIGLDGADEKMMKSAVRFVSLDDKAKALGVAKEMLTAFKKKRGGDSKTPKDAKEVVARLSKKVEQV